MMITQCVTFIKQPGITQTADHVRWHHSCLHTSVNKHLLKVSDDGVSPDNAHICNQ